MIDLKIWQQERIDIDRSEDLAARKDRYRQIRRSGGNRRNNIDKSEDLAAKAEWISTDPKDLVARNDINRFEDLAAKGETISTDPKIWQQELQQYR